jgi:hypothetical protein
MVTVCFITLFVFSALIPHFVHAQSDDPTINSWMINTDGAKGSSNDPTTHAVVSEYFADVQKVYYNNQNVFIGSTGIPSHPIGPFNDRNPSLPVGQDQLFRIPRTPPQAADQAVSVGLGAIGVFINGVVMFNYSDAVSYEDKDVWFNNAIVVRASGFDEGLGHPAPGTMMGGGSTPPDGGTPPDTGTPPNDNVPAIAESFLKFAGVNVSWDDEFLYVEGNGLPDHPMMIGITSWQQQVPLPQDFTGDNAFQIPLTPEYLEVPESSWVSNSIAIAANGIPIFHYLTQSGEDAYLNGELDEYGGHSGRADDYHYHLAPTFLQDMVGEGNPIAYGLDGIPIYASNPDIDKPLDEAHGYYDEDGVYRYVSSESTPYMIGAFRGTVNFEHQPHTDPVRPALTPLGGAVITGFTGTLEDGYKLEYEINGQKSYIQYTINDDGSYTFNFIDADGNVTTEQYTKSQGTPPDNGTPPDGEMPPQPGDGSQQPPNNGGTPPNGNMPPQPGDGSQPPQNGGQGAPPQPSGTASMFPLSSNSNVSFITAHMNHVAQAKTAKTPSAHELMHSQNIIHNHVSPSQTDETVGGVYHYHQQPALMRQQIGDDGSRHSPVIGYMFDGAPVYGPYGYANTDGSGGVVRIESSYRMREMTDRSVLPDGTVLDTNLQGPPINDEYPLGYFIEDFEYVEGLGHLDELNGRYAITPEYPNGVYAYYATIGEDGNSAFPYLIGPKYWGQPITQNIQGTVTLPDTVTEYLPETTVFGWDLF